MVGELHQLRRADAKARATELLEQFDLADAASKVAGDYSGGMRRRLDLAATLVARPQVLFLDEPTTGLDPRARNDLWAVLETLVGHGVTILLTTQYLEEADRLADDILVVDHGTVIARGDARSLKRQVGGDNIGVTVSSIDALDDVAEILGRITGCDPGRRPLGPHRHRPHRRRRRRPGRGRQRPRRVRRRGRGPRASASRRSTRCSSPSPDSPSSPTNDRVLEEARS